MRYPRRLNTTRDLVQQVVRQECLHRRHAHGSRGRVVVRLPLNGWTKRRSVGCGLHQDSQRRAIIEMLLVGEVDFGLRRLRRTVPVARC